MAMKRNILRRLFGGFFLLTLVLLLLFFAVLFFSLKNDSARLLGEEYKKYSEALAANLAPRLAAPDLPGLRQQVLALNQRAQWRLTVISADGWALADTAADSQTMENHFTRPEFLAALRGESAYAVRYSQTLGRDFLYAAAPIYAGEKIIGAVRISLSLQRVTVLFWPLIKTALLGALVFYTLLFLLAFRLARRIASSLNNLEDAASRAAGGDLTARVYLADRDEFQPLAEKFNQMATQLAGSLAQIRRQKTELETILESLPHGLLVVDGQGRLKLSSKSLRRITGVDELAGHFYWEIFRGAEFSALLERAAQDGQNHFGELLKNGRCYAVSVSPLPENDLVVLLQDITETRELERIKRDFVANAAHELRTPLTAIKGFAETLEDELSAAQKHYVAVIKNNTERLINIVRDIMALSELEAGQTLEKEKLNLKTLLAGLQNIFAARLKEKGLAFSIVEETPVETRGDVFKLQQVFINLLDNAVKYTEKGGVTVRIAKTPTRAVVSVEDSGTGIPPAEQSRIFERFYVVDRSRSRALGGTGLGLSIVKHIVLLHNGEITVESSPRGSKFIVALPL
ncbi:MAG: HAMP domain-containing protein [Candidatus Margulisbacteria bacterium]|jgi:two-component system phosphate regulon sensor histidine kinase PhoR|nr:HAMP domain-containing protein [Candidatus Margulisiibacteriota bacterium]